MALLLSIARGVGWTASFAASEAATISASQEASATLACFLDDHEIAARPCVNTQPVVEWRTAQSESEWPCSTPIRGGVPQGVRELGSSWLCRAFRRQKRHPALRSGGGGESALAATTASTSRGSSSAAGACEGRTEEGTPSGRNVSTMWRMYAACDKVTSDTGPSSSTFQRAASASVKRA
eukprot:4323956-Pleurochrysis_carterae.AAC.1